MKPVPVLPESYTFYGDFEPNKFTKAKIILLAATILLAVLLIFSLDRIFPNPDPAAGLAWRSLSVLQRFALFIICFYTWLWLHECTHAIFVWLFSGHWPEIRAQKILSIASHLPLLKGTPKSWDCPHQTWNGSVDALWRSRAA
jgi:hypothetical protein